MKLRGAWIDSAPLQAVCTALTSAGFKAFLVGGCVRNALLGAAQTDIDIATDATPDQTLACAKSAGLRAVPTGIEHGTITVIADGAPFEITTFRADVDTDGRHALVRFSTEIIEDARRRDFTMNALYATPQGLVVDPLGGLDDVLNGRVRFIGDAGTRLREDYLRSLRFFRFFAWYGRQDEGIDPEGLAAIAEHLDGLHQLSRERVGAEMIKLLKADAPVQAVAAMHVSGVLNAVVAGADSKALGPFEHHAAALGVPIDPIARLVALGGDAGDLRLSRADFRHYKALSEELASMKSVAHISYEHGACFALTAACLRAALLEMPIGSEVVSESNKGESAVFPISARDLMPALSGKALGERLATLKADWIASGFTLSRDELLG